MQRRALEKKEEIEEEGRQRKKEWRDRKRRLGGAEAEDEINSFVDLLLCCYLKSNAFFLQSFLPSS